jgi:hypothetical protein
MQVVDANPSPSAFDISPKTLPVLMAAHNRRLRQLWGFGRHVHVGQLGGLELDLVIAGLIEVETIGRHTGPVVVVTSSGVQHLNAVRQARVVAQRPHHDLGSRLASSLRVRGFLTWENVQFQAPSGQLVRPDVYACKPSLLARNAEPSIYEVKVSRADFLADVARPEKRGAYLQLAQAVYYCAPADLISKRDLPDGCGLVEEQRDGSFVIAKRARRPKSFSLTADIAMTLMVKRQSYGDDPVE